MTINDLVKNVPRDFHDCEIVIDNADYNPHRKIHSYAIDSMGGKAPRVILFPGDYDNSNTEAGRK